MKKELTARLEPIAELLAKYEVEQLRNLLEAAQDDRCFIAPVKVGQTVWFVRDPKRHPETVVETVVDKIVCKRTGIYMKLGCNAMYETACSSIGKTVFLTAKAAGLNEELAAEIKIPETDFHRIQEYLLGGGQEYTQSWSGKFGDGCEVDLRCCPDDEGGSWLEFLLAGPDGGTISCTDPFYELQNGDKEVFEVDGTKYAVSIVVTGD